MSPLPEPRWLHGGSSNVPKANPRKALKLLLVDDHPVVRSGLANMLAAHDAFEVVAEVGDGEHALQACGEHQPDVVLLDIMMPGLGGIDCLRQLKQQNTTTRVLILTSSDVATDVRAALEAGADGYVTKSVSSAELVAAIQCVAGGDAFVGEDVRQVLEQPTLATLLTPREVEVLQLLRKGMSNPDIGYILGITPRTAKAHVAAILVKLEAQDRAEAVARGFELGLLRP